MFICVTLYQWHSSFTHSVLDSFVSCLATKGGSLLVQVKDWPYRHDYLLLEQYWGHRARDIC